MTFLIENHRFFYKKGNVSEISLHKRYLDFLAKTTSPDRIFYFFNKKEYTKLCASPMLLDFFRLAAYNQIRSNQGYFRVSGCTF